jgi:hypothetical protein
MLTALRIAILQVGPSTTPLVRRLTTGAGAPSSMKAGDGGLPASPMKGKLIVASRLS